MRENIRVKVKKLHEQAKLPAYAHKSDAAMDVTALDGAVLYPETVVKVRTGLAFKVPDGYEMQIRPRSGLASKGITIINSPGTLDGGYVGELCILLHNVNPIRNSAPYRVRQGDRIAQILVKPVPKIVLEKVNELPDTERGSGGFGSTGV